MIIQQTEHLSNEEGLKTKRSRFLKIRKSQIKFLQHIPEYDLRNLAITGNTEGKMNRKEQWMSYLTNECKFILEHGMVGMMKRKIIERIGRHESLWSLTSKSGTAHILIVFVHHICRLSYICPFFFHEWNYFFLKTDAKSRHYRTGF